MALAKKSTVAVTKKLTVAKRLGCIMINKVVFKKNTNGNEFISTPFGAVYAKIKEIKPGLHCVVELSNGAFALNEANIDDEMEFLNEKLSKYPNLTVSDVKNMLGL